MHEIILSADIEKKLREIETRILSIVDFKEFFEVLLKEIKQKFAIPFAWITLIAGNDVTALIEAAGTSDGSEHQMTVIEKEVFLKLIGTTSKPLLVKDDLKPYYSVFPSDSSYFIKSIAMAPISLDGTVIGSLNLADFSTTRFHHRTYAQFLELLAIKVSICLSKVTAHEKINSLTFHDPITGLLNRNVMETILDREFRRNRRYKNDLSLVLIDLDDMYRAAGSFGVDWGDHLCKYVAEQVVQVSRDSDIITRFDAEKFAVIMPQTRAGDAMNLTGRIRRTYEEHPLRIKGRAVTLSINFGVASTENENITNTLTLLKHAEKNLARTKQVGSANHTQDSVNESRPKVIPLPIGKKK
jgi:diguanylate cyclase (GGDEF)-like protein